MWILYLVVTLIGTFAGRSHQVELGFLIQRQTCANVRTHLGMLYDCQPAKFVSVSACIDERVVLRCQPNHYVIVYTAEWQSADTIPGLPGCISDHLFSTAVVECAEGRSSGRCVLQPVSARCEGRRRCTFVGNEQDLRPPCSSGSSDQLPSSSSDRLTVTYACLPKLVLRDINTGRLPAGLCPPTDGTTLQSTNPTLLTGTRSTAAGSGADSEYRLHGNSGSPLPPTVPSEYELADETMTDAFETYIDWLQPGTSPRRPPQQVIGPPTSPSPSSAPTFVDHTSRQLVVVPANAQSRMDSRSALIVDWLLAARFIHDNREKAVVYVMLSLSAGIIILLAGALALLYWRCRSLGGATTSSHRNRKHYWAVSTNEPEPEVTPSMSSQPSPSATSTSNNWSQTVKSTSRDAVLQNGRACRDREPVVSDGSKKADGRQVEGPTGCVDPQQSSTLSEWDRSRQHCGGEIRGVGSGLDGLRQPPSGMSSFSITDLHPSPLDCPLTSPDRTPPLPPLTQGSTATVLARYWPPPDGQPGRQTTVTEGIPMTTVDGSYGLPSASARYGGPVVGQTGSRPAPSDAAVKAVHFNTVHNCEQLAADRAPPRGSQLSNVDEDLQGPGLNTSPLTAGSVGQSLPASYRCRNVSADAAQIQPSTPTATINRHYAVQPRTLYRPGLNTQPAATMCRNDGGDHGCPGPIGNGPYSLSPQCTISDDRCLSTPTSRIRHYCV